jgi:hypothetical protein
MKTSKYRWGFVPPLSIKGSIPNLIIILQIYIINDNKGKVRMRYVVIFKMYIFT